METTENHPFLSRKRVAKSTRRKGVAVRDTWWSADEWTPAKGMAGRHWAFPVSWPSMSVPPVTLMGRESVVLPVDERLLFLAGAYVGDGWVRINDRRGYTVLGLNPEKAAKIRPWAEDAGLKITEIHERTVVKMILHGRAVARWLQENFGSCASEKQIPMWLLGSSRSFRAAFLAGYAVTDGCEKSVQGWESMTATTVSRELALGLRSLGVTMGFATSVCFTQVPPTAVIEGRTVNQKPQWGVTFSTSTRTSVEDAGFRWQLVRRVLPARRETEVFNLEVEDDNSYIADGIAVHNCQAFSIAGLRRGMADARGNLALEYIRLAQRLRPRWILWENVPGVLSSNGGRDFGSFLGALGEIGYGFAYRVLDAQYFGLAQRRKRVFVVGYLGDWRRAAAVLFEPASLRGDPAPSREAREDVAGTLAAGAHPSGFNGRDAERGNIIPCLATALRARDAKGSPDSDATQVLTAYGGNCSGPIDVATTRTAKHSRHDFDTETFCVTGPVTHALKAEGADGSEDGTGRGTPIVPVSCFNAREDFCHYGNVAGALGSSSPQAQAVAVALRGRDGGATIEVENILTSGVRRLTPLECERLQGFPDNYTLVPHRGKPAADGPRYKALGNAFAVPVVQWIANRIGLEELRR